MPGVDRLENPLRRRSLCQLHRTPAFHATIWTQSAGLADTGSYRQESPLWRRRFAERVRSPTSHSAVRPHPAGMSSTGTNGLKSSGWWCITLPPTSHSAIRPHPAGMSNTRTYGLESPCWRCKSPKVIKPPANHRAIRPQPASECVPGANRLVSVKLGIARRTLPIMVAAAATDLPFLVHPAGMPIAGINAGNRDFRGMVALSMSPAGCFSGVSYGAS